MACLHQTEVAISGIFGPENILRNLGLVKTEFQALGKYPKSENSGLICNFGLIKKGLMVYNTYGVMFILVVCSTVLLPLPVG